MFDILNIVFNIQSVQKLWNIEMFFLIVLNIPQVLKKGMVTF